MMNTFSHTKVDAYIRCPAKFEKRYIQRIVPKKKAKPLALGSCMAAGLAAFRNHEKVKKGMIDALKHPHNHPKRIEEIQDFTPIDLAQEAFIKTWVTGGKVLSLDREEDPQRCVPRAVEILTEYCKIYEDDPEIFIQPEITFKEEIAPNIFYEGIIDGVVKLESGQIAIDEDKTASRLGDFYFKELRRSYQVLWYMAIANRLNLFKIFGPQKPMCLMNVLYIHKANFRFERQLAIKTVREIDESEKDLLKWIKQIQWAIEANHFPRGNSNTCLMFGGCEYLPLKDASDEIRETLIKSMYIPYLSREEQKKKDEEDLKKEEETKA